MERLQNEIIINSEHLKRQMKITIFGNYGFVFLAFPLVSDEYSEENDRKIIDEVSDYINNGVFRFVFVPTVENRIWKNTELDWAERSNLHYKYNSFLVEEVLPSIFKIAGSPTPIITFGCGESGYFAGNSFFRHPDLFFGTVLFDAFFDIRRFCGDRFDENCYFNSPLDFLPNLEEEYWLIHLRARKYIHFLADETDNESLIQAQRLSQILKSKNINHNFEQYNSTEGDKITIWSRLFVDIVKRYF